MTALDEVLFTGFGLGMLLMLCSVVVTNLAVQRMRGVLNRDRAPDNQLGWSDAVQKVAQNVIDSYRAAYPQGPLYRNLVIGYSMFAIGLVIGIGSAIALKFTN